MPDLIELLRKIESASGADRELDAHIAAEVAGLSMTFCDFETGCYHGDCACPGCGKPLGLSDERHSYPARWEDDERLPLYTASIDAALALVERVLPGCNGSIHFGEPHRNPFAHLAPLRTDGRHPVDGAGANIALAVLAALLRAKLSAQGEGER